MRKRKCYSPIYLKAIDSDHWRSLKAKASKRASSSCEHCQAKVGLTLHHKHYHTLGCELLMDVQLLCELCHEKADRQRRANGKKKRKGPRRKGKRWQRWEQEATRPANLGEYLDSKWWKAKEKELLQRAGHQCTCCGSTDGVEVRHKTHSRLFAENDGDLLVLCRTCHDFVHGR